MGRLTQSCTSAALNQCINKIGPSLEKNADITCGIDNLLLTYLKETFIRE